MNRGQKLAQIVQNHDGLKVRLKDSSNIRLNLIYATLKHRGITDSRNFVNPTNFTKTSLLDINNIKEIKSLEDAVKDGKRIGVLVDVDCDGMMSSAILINYFNDNYDDADIHPIFPKAKLHGVKNNFETISEYIEKHHINYLVCPDSSSNDAQYIYKLENTYGVKTLVIDHHTVELEKAPMLLINNQVETNGKTVNKNFTGTGMVYESLRYLDSKNNTDYANGYLDLLAIGQIADMSDISDLEIRSLMLRGFRAVNNPLLSQYIKSERIKLSPKSLQFSIIPLINAVMRIGTQEEKNTLFNALIKDDSKKYTIKKRRTVNHHYKYVDVDASIYDYTIKMMNKIKTSQKKKIDKALKNATYLTLKEHDEVLGCFENVNVVKIDNGGAGITGLIANKLLGDTGKASFVLYDTKNPNIKTGSMRIPMAYTDTIERLRERFKQSDLGNLIFVQGHENASGISFKLTDELVRPTLKALNEMFKPVENVYDVDDFYINNTPSTLTCRNVDDMEYCFGGKVKEPVISILGLKVYESNFKINKNTLHINVNGIDFIKFNISEFDEDIIENIFADTYETYIDIVGTVGINRFLGKETPQFIINDFMFTDKIEDDVDDDLIF